MENHSGVGHGVAANPGRHLGNVPQGVGVNAIDVYVPGGAVFILPQRRGEVGEPWVACCLLEALPCAFDRQLPGTVDRESERWVP